MNVAITGATGFIGSHLAPRLQRQGHEVRTLGRRPTQLPGVRHYGWNDLNSEPPPEALQGVHAVFNLAGEPVAQRWTSEVKRRIFASRVIGTRNLVTALGRVNTSASLISASGIGYYGDRSDELLTELSAPGKDFLAGVCVEWEREAMRARQFGSRVVTLRTGIVLGLGGGALSQMVTPFRAGVGGPVGSGRQWVSWIHLDDLIDLMMFVLDYETLSGSVNSTAPNPLRNADFAQALGAALGRPAVVPVPVFGLRLLYGEAASALVASQRAVPEAASRAGFEFRYTNCAHALRRVLTS